MCGVRTCATTRRDAFEFEHAIIVILPLSLLPPPSSLFFSRAKSGLDVRTTDNGPANSVGPPTEGARHPAAVVTQWLSFFFVFLLFFRLIFSLVGKRWSCGPTTLRFPTTQAPRRRCMSRHVTRVPPPRPPPRPAVEARCSHGRGTQVLATLPRTRTPSSYHATTHFGDHRTPVPTPHAAPPFWDTTPPRCARPAASPHHTTAAPHRRVTPPRHGAQARHAVTRTPPLPTCQPCLSYCHHQPP